jgi:hypothetical protein
MIGRLGPGTAAAALVSAAIGLAACAVGNGTSTPPAPQVPRQFASVQQAMALPSAPCATRVCIYVANSKDIVTAYAVEAHGNVAPLQAITGSNTRLSGADGVALDAGRNIYVVNVSGGSPSGYGSVTVYAAGATGNAPPIRSIGGPNTRLAAGEGVSLDATGNIYVATYNSGCRTICGGGHVRVFAAGANGNVAPIRTFGGSRTKLDAPVSIALDPRGRIYVSNWLTNSVTVYAAGAKGDPRPIQYISGSKTGLHDFHAIAVDANGNIYVANSGHNDVLVFSAGAEGNVAPMATISGSNTGLNYPVSIALDGRRNIYVGNGANNLLTFAAGANGNVAPIRTIGGSKTLLNGPGDIAVH